MEREPINSNLVVIAKCENCDWVYSYDTNRFDSQNDLKYVAGVAEAHAQNTYHSVDISIVRL
jgi:hypothetical protein